MAQLFGLARIGRDCELRTLTNGDAVANVSLAFNYGRKGEDGKRPTQWLDGAIYGKRAEALAPYLLKGQQVAVTLEDVHIQTFTTRDNTEGTKLVGKISQIELAGGSREQAAPAPRSAPAPTPRPAPRPAPRAAEPEGDWVDDVPF